VLALRCQKRKRRRRRRSLHAAQKGHVAATLARVLAQ
jgi:hypothetical protein